jgi:hypothetical protein
MFRSIFFLMFPGLVFTAVRNNGAVSRLARHQQSNTGVRVPA